MKQQRFCCFFSNKIISDKNQPKPFQNYPISDLVTWTLYRQNCWYYSSWRSNSWCRGRRRGRRRRGWLDLWVFIWIWIGYRCLSLGFGALLRQRVAESPVGDEAIPPSNNQSKELSRSQNPKKPYLKRCRMYKKEETKNLENKVPQSHLYSLVPQIFEWAFQSDWTAYFFEHLSHFHFFSPCFLQKCFFIPVKSPKALDGSWWTQDGSGQTYTRFRTSLLDLCRSFHGRLWPRRWSCKFWSRWNPLLQISQTNRFVAMRVLGDKAITSASGSAKFEHQTKLNNLPFRQTSVVYFWRSIDFTWHSGEVSFFLGCGLGWRRLISGRRHAGLTGSCRDGHRRRII